jgi:hypothetical protein
MLIIKIWVFKKVVFRIYIIIGIIYFIFIFCWFIGILRIWIKFTQNRVIKRILLIERSIILRFLIFFAEVNLNKIFIFKGIFFFIFLNEVNKMFFVEWNFKVSGIKINIFFDRIFFFNKSMRKIGRFKKTPRVNKNGCPKQIRDS